MEKQVQELFDEAVKKLHEANEELCRPEEDVVSHLVCKNSQLAMENFLKAYLLKLEVNLEKYENINSLYYKCIAVNPKFATVGLDDFTCKHDQFQSRACSDPDKVSRCFQMAEKMNALLKQEDLV